MWNIRKEIKKGDYLYAVVPEHPKANKYGYVLYHRIVMENKLNRLLKENEEVHHIDKNRYNNNPDNLEVLLKGEHQRLHSTKYPNGHFVDYICAFCGKNYRVAYNKRQELKHNKNNFCSRRCNGLFLWKSGKLRKP